jgi:hypothetical protein
MTLYRFERIVRWRYLRTYTRIAFKHHGPCSTCGHDISPGDPYQGMVYVRRGKLRVEKDHLFCPSDWYEEQSRRVASDHRKEEAEKKKEKKLKVA